MEKTLKLVATFKNTHSAMAMEKYCKEQNLPGRIIPVPREISASCGFAWMAEPQDKAPLEALAAEKKVDVEGWHEVMLKA